jgi:MFS family permease
LSASPPLPSAAPAEEPLAPPPQAPQVIQRNYALGVLNGVLFTLGDNFSNASLVLALLIRQLGGSLVLVGLLPALQSGGFLLPQLFVGGRLQAMPYKLPLYRNAALARSVAYLILTAVMFAAAHLPPTLSLWLIVICFTIFQVGGGTSALAFQDVVAKTIPPRQRGRFFGARQLFGGLLAFAVAGPLVRWLLSADGPLPFSYNFGALGLLTLLVYAVGMYAFGIVQEPAQTRPGQRLRVIEGLRRAPQILRHNRNYRWFILTRMLTRSGQIAEPFYILYATEALSLPPSIAGIYLALRALAGAVSNILWGRISARLGDRSLLLVSSAVLALVPALALGGPPLATALQTGVSGLIVVLGLVFLVSGAAIDGSNIASMTYLLEVVPEDERPTYMALANTTLGIVTFVPVLGGWLVAALGYRATFALGLLFALLGLAAARQLGPPEPAARP